MPRFFINPESWDTDDLKLEGDEFHHCINVLRLQEGDPIIIFNGQGTEMETTINSVSKKISKKSKKLNNYNHWKCVKKTDPRICEFKNVRSSCREIPTNFQTMEVPPRVPIPLTR